MGSGAAQQLSASCRSLRLPRRSPEKRTLGEIVRKAASGTLQPFTAPTANGCLVQEQSHGMCTSHWCTALQARRGVSDRLLDRE